jgi:hypothetical protein
MRNNTGADGQTTTDFVGTFTHGQSTGRQGLGES